MKSDEGLCPKCAEVIKKIATKCKHCGSDITPTPVTPASGAEVAGGLGCMLLIILAIGFGLKSCSDAGQKSEEDIAGEVAEAAANRTNGFHCLSGWDGSHDGVVTAVKAGLREPGSFEHIETIITPVDAKGNHALLMKYRARNGFGGMNLGGATARITQQTCMADDIKTAE